MKQILIYSDSLTWGIIPNTRQRLSFDARWPGVFENALNAQPTEEAKGSAENTANKKDKVRVIENCLNGRRTVWSDPFKEGRDGSEGFAQVLEMHAPLQLVVVLLGTNDFQCTHNNSAWMSAQGMAKLIQIIRNSPIEPGMPHPEILVVAPPEMAEPKGALVTKFVGSQPRSIGLSQHLQQVCQQFKVHFFDGAKVTGPSKVDGIHLDADQHYVLGTAIADVVKDLALLESNLPTKTY